MATPSPLGVGTFGLDLPQSSGHLIVSPDLWEVVYMIILPNPGMPFNSISEVYLELKQIENSFRWLPWLGKPLASVSPFLAQLDT